MLGYVSKEERDSSKNDVRILLGDGGRVYAASPDVKDEICRVGDCIDSFIEKGLKRYYRFYHKLTEEETGFLVEGVDKTTRYLIKEYNLFCVRIQDRKLQFKLSWPPGAVITFHNNRDPFLNLKSPEDEFITRLPCIGSVENTGYIEEPISIYGDRNSNVYGYVERTGQIVYLAPYYENFLKIGLRPFFKSYVYGSHNNYVCAPMCPYSIKFYQKLAPYALCDLVLEEFINGVRPKSYSDQEHLYPAL